MFTRLELENFKAFKHRASLNLKPITLLFGQNSSGKSSVLQALYLLKQTVDHGDPQTPLLFSVENGIADLGNFQEVIYGHQEEGTFSIRLDAKWKIDHHYSPLPTTYGEIYKDGEDPDWPAANTDVGIDITFSSEKEHNGCKIVRYRLYTDDNDSCIEFIPIIMPNGKSKFIPYNKRFPLDITEITTKAYKEFQNKLKEMKSNFLEKLIEELKNQPKEGMNEFVDNKVKERNQLLFDEEEEFKKENAVLKTALVDFYEYINKFDQNKGELRAEELEFSTSFRDLLNNGVLDSFGLPECEYFLPGKVVTAKKMWNTADVAVWDAYANDCIPLEFTRYGHSYHPCSGHSINYLFGAALNLYYTLERVYCLGPFRSYPRRYYTLSGKKEMGFKAEHLAELLFRKSDCIEEVNKWLDKLDIGYNLKINRIPLSSNDLYEMRLIDSQQEQETSVCITDVGFGVSQILPVVVQSATAKDSCILIEQPELHISLTLQARLGSMFAESVKERGNQFIIETHSEHLILRLQRLIRKKELTPDQVGIFYISRGKKGSEVKELRLGDDGEFIDDWPHGFFAERLRELLD